ncbi:hypothetical protein BFX40_23660 [Mesorhizobium sp. SEMIA 3007]|uniref:hypothetical protein n=1 Tax=Mesorhizobium sp. SEMIA 3007 TaxID=1862350 RepID=UPI00083CCE2E|nr:hypothetical protein [Mesorhizobium sp. SEMIA 3007]ODA95560.1 hypothetical protein BFX40_23660 [Mesorhizobium sp. SEMIA 3007]
MGKSLSLSEAAAILADPPSSVGFPTDVRDDTSSSNVVSFKNTGKKGLSIADGARMLADAESGRGNNSRSRKFRDPGGDLSISDAAKLLVGQTPKYEGRLTKSQGVDELLGRNNKGQSTGGRLTKSQAAQLLTGASSDNRSSGNIGSYEGVVSDYVIESQNASIAFANTLAAWNNLSNQFSAFANAVASSFPEVVEGGDTAVMRMGPARYRQFLTAEEQFYRFEDAAKALYDQHAQAWSQAVHVENLEFLARNPDFDEADADMMAAVLVSVVGENEAIALASPNATVSASDPRILDVLKIAAGTEDGDTIIQTLVGAGFNNMDIAAIANGTARCHVLDHRVRTILLRAARNIESVEED